jgi:hypothetical protein
MARPLSRIDVEVVMDSAQTRSERRRQLVYYLKVYSGDTGNLLGNLVDLTRHGVMLLSREAFPQGWAGEVRIALPQPIAELSEITMRLEARWSRKDVNPEYFITGFQVTSLPAEAAPIIDHLIATYGFKG